MSNMSVAKSGSDAQPRAFVAIRNCTSYWKKELLIAKDNNSRKYTSTVTIIKIDVSYRSR